MSAIKPEYYDRVVELFDQGMLQKDIAKELGIKKQALAFQMKKFGFSFKRDSYRLSEQDIDKAVELYSSGISSNQIANILGQSKDTILYAIRARGVQIKTKEQIKFYQNYTINENAFSDIHEEGCAYFYGWILTDGCLSKKSVSIELCSVDEELLYNLKNYLESSNGIRRRSRTDKRTGNTYHQSSFAFSHTPILERLIAFGLEPKKSLKEVCPDEFIDNRHFWRGVVEGDGHIAKNSYGLEICGGWGLISSFSLFCKSIVPDCPLKFSKNGKMDVVRIRSKYACKLILDELYRDCELKLSRKYNRYMEKYYGTDPC